MVQSQGRALPTAGGPVAAPPFALPAVHFAAALFWLLVSAGLLVWLAPRLAMGRVFDPPVFALVHALMLGVVGSAIFGTLQQFVPGGLGVPLRSVRLGFASFALLQFGVTILVLGFLGWRGWAQGLGWLAILGAVGGVSRNVLRARRHSVNGKLVGLYITVAHSALGFGMIVAFARIGETLGWWQVDRMALVSAHALLGAVGFGLLSVIGVGSRMLPTFLMGPGDDTRWLHWQLGLTVLALLVYTAGAVLTAGWLMQSGAWLLMAAAVPTLMLPWRWFARRRRPLDGALWQVASSMLALAAATAVGLWLLLGDPYRFSRWAALLVALVAGCLAVLVVGVMAKILPHLSYINLARHMPGFAALGSPNALLRDDWQCISAVCLGAGWSLLVVALLAEHAAGARAAAALWALGTGLVVVNTARMYVVGRRPARIAPQGMVTN
ncbi:hypothetical protein [Gemmatimonas sp. UBA7669]|uniref:hypothetical protein n=1 Tax=Gemmatimonas sp. UBA7669 TaxID=1946568 RepID=UPI0025C32720|nr:hypothetical protein [Gemmatimonas sp. UBA7669]